MTLIETLKRKYIALSRIYNICGDLIVMVICLKFNWWVVGEQRPLSYKHLLPCPIFFLEFLILYAHTNGTCMLKYWCIQYRYVNSSKTREPTTDITQPWYESCDIIWDESRNNV